MNWIIIDSDKDRALTLKDIMLDAFKIVASHIRFLDENSEPSVESLYLIHNSDGYVDDFANKSKSLDASYVVFYSGGGLSNTNLKANGATIGYYSGVFQNGDESGFKELITKVKDVVDGHDGKKKDKFQKLFGYNPILESKLNFLHHCLTPDGLANIDVTSSEWANLEEFKKLTEATDGPFGDKYLSALRTLSDKLLAS